MKTCRKCEIEKPTSEFFRDKSAPLGVESWCKNCRKESRQTKEYSKMQRNWHLKSKYGITQEEYELTLEEQNGRCAICGEDDPVILRGSYSFVQDHSHECCPGQITCGECLRGLLCHSCNLGLGNFKDSLSILRSAVRYLEYYS